MPLVRVLIAATAVLLSAAAIPAAGQDQPVGERFEIRPEDLPEPHATEAVDNSSQTVTRLADATLDVPDGFTATLFADGLDGPREFVVLPNGDVLVSEPRAGRITLLRDEDLNGTADLVEIYADGFTKPYGLALQGYDLYVADSRGVWRLTHTIGDLQPAGEPVLVTAAGALGDGSGHSARSLAVHPDGSRFYVGIGSKNNIAEEAPPRATVQEFVLAGEGIARQRTFASGLRNPVGLAFHPETGDLYTVVNERDGLGDGLVPDFLTRLQDGAFYGWPYAYIGPNPQPDYAERAPEEVARTRVPDLLFQAHSAPIGLAFYNGEMFPDRYHGDAFVALRGSWNRSEPVGYTVVWVPFENGRPLGWYETFASGFWVAGEQTAQVWGRPTGLAVAADGALLVADDTGNTIWRIGYAADAGAAAGSPDQ